MHWRARARTTLMQRAKTARFITMMPPFETVVTRVEEVERARFQAPGDVATASSRRSRDDAPTCSFLGPSVRSHRPASVDQYSSERLGTWRVRPLDSPGFKRTRSKATRARTANCAEELRG